MLKKGSCGLYNGSRMLTHSRFIAFERRHVALMICLISKILIDSEKQRETHICGRVFLVRLGVCLMSLDLWG